MATKVLKGTGLLIALYIGAKNAPGLARLFSSAGQAGGGIIKNLQGR